jgi:taspase (threonine aspartase 1)
MQDSEIFSRRLNLSKRLGETWKVLRRIRTSINTPSGKAGKYVVEVLPSPFRFDIPTPFESDRNDYPLSFASVEQIRKMNREIQGQPTKIGGLVMDGAEDKRFGGSKSPAVAAIFVHAGAGYHSTTNEHIHLSACKE